MVHVVVGMLGAWIRTQLKVKDVGDQIFFGQFTNSLRSGVVRAVRMFRKARNKLTIARLRAKGCAVAWSAVISADVVLERGGGQISIGASTFLDKGVILRAFGGSIAVGGNCSVNAYSLISGLGGVRIGDSVRIGSHVTIMASNHIFNDAARPIREQGLTSEGIQIDDDVWIGAGVRVLDGVEVGCGCVLAAGAVVNRSCAPLSIVAGVPGRVIGVRGSLKGSSP